MELCGNCGCEIELERLDAGDGLCASCIRENFSMIREDLSSCEMGICKDCGKPMTRLTVDNSGLRHVECP